MTMKRKVLGSSFLVVLCLFITTPVLAAPEWNRNPKGFEHGIKLDIEGEYYYFKGPGSTPGAIDVPGHTWVQAGHRQVIGRHYNVGPGGAPSWWAASEPDGVLLYKVHGVFDKPPGNISNEREQWLKSRGYVHVHELVNASNPMNPDGTWNEAEDLVVYLKHTAVREFDFTHMAVRHVTPGIDYDFMPNW